MTNKKFNNIKNKQLKKTINIKQNRLNNEAQEQQFDLNNQANNGEVDTIAIQLHNYSSSKKPRILIVDIILIVIQCIRWWIPLKTIKEIITCKSTKNQKVFPYTAIATQSLVWGYQGQLTNDSLLTNLHILGFFASAISMVIFGYYLKQSKGKCSKIIINTPQPDILQTIKNQQDEKLSVSKENSNQTSKHQTIDKTLIDLVSVFEENKIIELELQNINKNVDGMLNVIEDSLKSKQVLTNDQRLRILEQLKEIQIQKKEYKMNKSKNSNSSQQQKLKKLEKYLVDLYSDKSKFFKSSKNIEENKNAKVIEKFKTKDNDNLSKYYRFEQIQENKSSKFGEMDNLENKNKIFPIILQDEMEKNLEVSLNGEDITHIIGKKVINTNNKEKMTLKQKIFYHILQGQNINDDNAESKQSQWSQILVILIIWVICAILISKPSIQSENILGYLAMVLSYIVQYMYPYRKYELIISFVNNICWFSQGQQLTKDRYKSFNSAYAAILKIVGVILQNNVVIGSVMIVLIDVIFKQSGFS